jgi:hypothetical protein
VCESEAALSDGAIEALDGGEAAVGERFVDKPPEMFGRLELGFHALATGVLYGGKEGVGHVYAAGSQAEPIRGSRNLRFDSAARSSL